MIQNTLNIKLAFYFEIRSLKITGTFFSKLFFQYLFIKN